MLIEFTYIHILILIIHLPDNQYRDFKFKLNKN